MKRIVLFGTCFILLISWSVPANAAGQCSDGFDNDNDTFIDEFDPGCLGKWNIKQSMPTPRGGVAASVIKKKIYVVGGRSSDFPENNLTTTEVYIPVSDEWKSVTPMNQGRLSPVLESVENKLYAISGLYKIRQTNTFDMLSSIEEYDPVLDTWSYKAEIPSARYGASSAVLNGSIYVFGGSNGVVDGVASVDVYTPDSDSWATITSLPTPRTSTGAATLGGKIYVVGGQDLSAQSLDIVEVYDAQENKWSSISPLPIPVVSPGVVVLNNTLYVYGGFYRDETGKGVYIDQIFEYVETENSWKERSVMPIAKSQFGYVSLDDKLYAIGGGTYNGQAVFHSDVEEFIPSLSEGVILPPQTDPLILQYAPRLAMHEGEDYLPMDVETYVEGSGLWSLQGVESDSQVKTQTALTFDAFESIIGSDDTLDYYLAFSDPEHSKSLDLGAAKTKYDASNASTTVYYRKMDDGDYTVLQYWYFYAMNNWREQGGFNNHEGDWESVFVFLDKDTKKPKYVAYSAHHNDGDSMLNVLQYDSVRRNWDSTEVVKTDDQVVSFVALGSHANYPNNNNGTHRVGFNKDKTSTTGTLLTDTDFTQKSEILPSSPFWMNYEGMWGTDRVVVPGGSGPQGPVFSDVSGHIRFSNPIEWAGIDLIEKKIWSVPDALAVFEKSDIKMRFDALVDAGTEILIEPHSEWISFGDLENNVTLLPGFWDITSNLENGTFSVEVTLPYDPAVLIELGGKAKKLAVYFYDPVLDAWQMQESIVDRVNENISFETSHFSRYALGFEQEEASLEDLFDKLVDEVKATELSKYKTKNLVRYIRLVERFAEKDRKVMHKIAKKLLKNIKYRIKIYEKRNLVSKEERDQMLDTISQIKHLI